MGLTHFDDAPASEYELGHIRGRWTLLGQGAGSETVGCRRIQLPAGGWSTPVHEHGRAEEIFYVLAGTGVSWQDGRASRVGPDDCIVYLPRRGAHTLHALEALDVLAFGTREHDESPRFPRLGLSMAGAGAVDSVSSTRDGVPLQHLREAELGPPELPSRLEPRPSTIVNLADVEPRTVVRSRVERTRRRISALAGSRHTGLQHVEVAAGRESTAQHCHSVEEEMFVILLGHGALVLDDEETAVGPGNVVARPAGTGVSHMFRAGPAGLTYLAYGNRDPSDLCYYRRSNKIAFRGVGVIARLQGLDYWDGED